MVTHGVCGVDHMAETEASRPGLTVGAYEAEWEWYGMRAGFLSNETMPDLPGVRDIRASRTAGTCNGTATWLGSLAGRGGRCAKGARFGG